MVGMISVARFGALWLTAVAAVSAIATPDKDSFYTPSGNWQSAKAGDILNSRQVNVSVGNLDIKEAYQVLYRTSQNTPNDAQHSVATVLIPSKAGKDKLVVAPFSQDSNAPFTAPSYVLASHAKESMIYSIDESLLAPYLSAGYIVTVPDAEGPLNNFAAGRSEGYQTLDSIRATLGFNKAGLAKDAKVAGYGYSAGGQAVSWAAALKRSYAPELNVAGWAFGGSIPNVTSLIYHTDNTPMAGYAVAAITGLVDAYPDLKKEAESDLTQAGLDALEFARNNNIDAVLQKFSNVNILSGQYVKRSGVLANMFSKRAGSLLSSAAYRDVARQVTQGISSKEVPDAPVYLYHAIADQVAPYNDVLGTSRSWCQNGAQIDFVTFSDPSANHLVTRQDGSAAAFAFLQNQFNGQAPAKGCTYSTTGKNSTAQPAISYSSAAPGRSVPVPVATSGSAPAASSVAGVPVVPAVSTPAGGPAPQPAPTSSAAPAPKGPLPAQVSSASIASIASSLGLPVPVVSSSIASAESSSSKSIASVASSLGVPVASVSSSAASAASVSSKSSAAAQSSSIASIASSKGVPVASVSSSLASKSSASAASASSSFASSSSKAAKSSSIASIAS